MKQKSLKKKLKEAKKEILQQEVRDRLAKTGEGCPTCGAEFYSNDGPYR